MAILVLILGLLVSSCATVQSGRQVTPEETAWIERGTTTWAEVVAKLGAPRFEHSTYSPTGFTTKTTTSTTAQNDGTTLTTNSTTELQHQSRHTKATYMYTRSNAAVLPFYANVQTQHSQFWVEYDEKGIVQDYGFLGDVGGTPR